MKKIHYIGWYIGEGEENKYTGNIPGKLKMRYIAQKILDACGQVTILSLADKVRRGLYRIKKVKNNNLSIIYTGGVAGKSKLVKGINVFFKYMQFIWYVLFCVNKNDTIILYHSVAYTKLLKAVKVFVKRFVVLEVEEIYGYSATGDCSWVNNEIKAIKAMDAYIFVNDGMPVELGVKDKDWVVSYGVIDIPDRCVQRYNDGLVHVVYAGTIERRKFGALMAVEVAKYLPNNYAMHIIGFGSEENIEFLRRKIDEANAGKNHAMVSYDGYKTGRELDSFLFKCHIGLSSNVMRPNFANNSFPSKVITYMCHDLSVVLGYAKAFYDAPIANKWRFYYEYKAEQIAQAITEAKITPLGYYRSDLLKLDESLIAFLKRVL